MFLSPWQAHPGSGHSWLARVPKGARTEAERPLEAWSGTDIVSLPARHHPSPPAMGGGARDRGHVYSFFFFLIYTRLRQVLVGACELLVAIACGI